MTEREKRLKRLAIRSWRRGTKEMDLILGRFWDTEGSGLDDAARQLRGDVDHGILFHRCLVDERLGQGLHE